MNGPASSSSTAFLGAAGLRTTSRMLRSRSPCTIAPRNVSSYPQYTNTQIHLHLDLAGSCLVSTMPFLTPRPPLESMAAFGDQAYWYLSNILKHYISIFAALA